MTERRYNETEVAEIFAQAAEAQVPAQRQLPRSEGMTLAQLQEIGREVGIPVEQLAQAAKALELKGRATSRSFFGLPIGVGVIVELGRKLTDEEWERIVVDLRETFDARGKQSREGSFRQWTNGNLQALLEPSGTGQRLRLRTVKGDARGLIVGGLSMLGFATVAGSTALVRGGVDDRGLIMALVTLATMGVGMLGGGAFRLPGWAKLRRRQMEEVAARSAVIASAPSSEGGALGE
jgi:hypothetical protein